MANLRFIEDYSSVEELFEELQCHLHSTVVLCSKKQLAKMGIDLSDAHQAASSYSCGGEADVWLDIVTDGNHYFIQSLKEAKRNGRNKISPAVRHT
jgi:hypothetical protein